MFEHLQNGFGTILRTLRGEGKITEGNISDTLRQVQRVLLSADVNYKVVKNFIQSVKTKSLGVRFSNSLAPGQLMIKIINDELVALLGSQKKELNIATFPPTVIMLVGLQGSGKTTTAAKLAAYLNRRNQHPLLVPADIYRPAAEEQLKILGRQLNIPVYCEQAAVSERVSCAIKYARHKHLDTLIIDTAGRLHIDEKMMDELKMLKTLVHPQNILLVVDAMTGQDAVQTAEAFEHLLDLTGILLTKMDSDARGGAALSMVQAIRKPIMFIGKGEKPGDLEAFDPERIANRILGMGDIVTLVEKIQESVDLEQASKIEQKIRKENFTLQDFLIQIRQVEKIGSMDSILNMLPHVLRTRLYQTTPDKKLLKKTEAIIQSMTLEERNNPGILNGSRRRRIARGSGTTPQDVNRVLNQYWQIVNMTRQMGKFKIPKNLASISF